MEATNRASKDVCKAISLICHYCEAGVPVSEFRAGDNNLYHNGRYVVLGYESNIILSPCTAYRIRRHFNFLDSVVSDE